MNNYRSNLIQSNIVNLIKQLGFIILIIHFLLTSFVYGSEKIEPSNLLINATLSSSSTLSEKFLPERVIDKSSDTRWAVSNKKNVQQIFTAEFKPKSFTADTLIITPVVSKTYDAWKDVNIFINGKLAKEYSLEKNNQKDIIFRFTAQVVSRIDIEIVNTHTVTHYIGISSMGLYLDPNRIKNSVISIPTFKSQQDILVEGRVNHPMLDVNKAQYNIQNFIWAKTYWQQTLLEANKWIERSPEEWLEFLPAQGATYAYGHSGCPIHKTTFGEWDNANASWDKPRQIECTDGHAFPDVNHPDTGTGYKAPDGKMYYFIGIWNAWVTETWATKALPTLATAYIISGDERFGRLAVILFDALASIYPESDKGSVDYPSEELSGRLARPFYQVSRALVVYAEVYDLLYKSKALDEPSLRVGLTRRQNIEKNLLENGAYYCYVNSFRGGLNNGTADYALGALAVGVVLGIPEYVHNGIDMIQSMITNNIDRDGQYYESSQSYGMSARSLYLRYAELLLNYKDDKYPNGINLYNNERFVSFLEVPVLSVSVAGHVPNIGDSRPNINQAFNSKKIYYPLDHFLAEMVRAGTTSPLIHKRFESLLGFLAENDIDIKRRNLSGGHIDAQRWLLFNAEPLSGNVAELDNNLKQRLLGSWNQGQKGIAILRDGIGEDSQAAIMRYGPTLTHGHLDELGLTYYAKGWQMTSDLGYVWSSTHTQNGWAKQTSSHTTVVVNEKSQLGKDGSGGNLHLFATVPGLQLSEASSPLAYSSEGVKEYRRTIALIGQGKDQVLIDFFRVNGGVKHDYIVGTQGKNQVIKGVHLGETEKGSLAGIDIDWGTKQDIDGNIVGFADKKRWMAPPGNGYGFIYNIRRGITSGSVSSTWTLGGLNDAQFRVHLLAEPGDQIITGQAPGIYPSISHYSYSIWSRQSIKGESLSSVFSTVMEPYSRPLSMSVLTAIDLLSLQTSSDFITEYRPYSGILQLQANKNGGFSEFRFTVPEDGIYYFECQFQRGIEYGIANIIIDGEVIGDIQGFDSFQTSIGKSEFKPLFLTAGEHSVGISLPSLESRKGGKMIGLSSFSIQGESQKAKNISPILSHVERLSVQVNGSVFLEPAAIRLVRQDGTIQIAISSAVENTSVVVDTEFGKVELDGAFVLLTGRGNKLLNISGSAVKSVMIDGRSLKLPKTIYTSTVTSIDNVRGAVEVKGAPTDGGDKWMVMFDALGYSRNSSYHVQSMEASKGSRTWINLNKNLILGEGIIADKDNGYIMTHIPHEYSRKIGHDTNSRFFEGKEILSEETLNSSRINKIIPGMPTRILVDKSEHFKINERYFYMDIQVGDNALMTRGFSYDIN